MLAKNCSDHVHYYQGGKPFRYYLLDPSTGEFSTTVLGPELYKGQKLQLPVKGGLFKCGKIEDGEEESSFDHDYTLIAEAVAPGFDFHDFTWITKDMLNETVKDTKVKELLLGFVNAESTEIHRDNKTVDAAAEFYEEGESKAQREAERA
jgi:predicted cupin superfamily sugar epimerase